MSRISTWIHLCVATAVLAATMYWLFNAGMLLGHLSEPMRSSLVMTFLPGVMIGSMAGGSVHGGFGTGFWPTVLTGVCSGAVWGTILFLLPRLARAVGRGLLRAA